MQFRWPQPSPLAPVPENAPRQDDYTAYGSYAGADGVKKPKKRSTFILIFVLAVLTFFAAVSGYTFLWLRHAGALIELTVLLALIFVGLTIPGSRGKPIHKPLGVMCIIALVLGVIFGVGVYDHAGYDAQMYEGLRSYSDVEPEQLAGTVRDAGTLTFAVEASLDREAAVGYAGLDGTKYCVAPIRRNSSSATSSSSTNYVGTVQFWAVGIDCCDWRGSFDCGSATDSSARSGIVQLARRGAFNRTDTDFEGFDDARRKAEVVLGVASVPHPIFVRWATQKDLDLHSWIDIFVAWMIIIFLTIAFACLTALLVRRMLDSEAKRMAAEERGWPDY